jgi:hypothetical protein
MKSTQADTLLARTRTAMSGSMPMLFADLPAV